MTSSGHVTSSGSCPIDRSWPLSYTLSIGTVALSGFVSEIFSAKVATTISDVIKPVKPTERSLNERSGIVHAPKYRVVTVQRSKQDTIAY